MQGDGQATTGGRHHNTNEALIARLLASGYLRLLAQGTSLAAGAVPERIPTKPVDSVRDKSLNWVEREGPRDV